MDIFYNKTVTVYNRYEDGKEMWFPTVLEAVRLLINRGENVSKSGTDSADSAKLSIRMEDLKKPYKKPLEWQQSEDKENSFTLTGKEDFFVEGDTSAEEILESDFFAYMKGKYDNCFKITNVDTYELIPHFEVGGA